MIDLLWQKKEGEESIKVYTSVTDDLDKGTIGHIFLDLIFEAIGLVDSLMSM